MYRDSPQRLRRMDYCNGVQGVINYATSNPRNICGCNIRCLYKRCKNKTFLDLDAVTMHLLHKQFIEEYPCWYAHRELFVPYETMVERMVESTSSTSNVHGVINDHNNPYKTMYMDAMRMNQGHAIQCPIIDEEPNVDVAKFFDLLKDSDEPLWDNCTNHSKLSVVA